MLVKTETVTRTYVESIINGKTCNYADISVAVVHPEEIQLVIGAAFSDRQCCYFDRLTLQELINDLQALHDAEWKVSEEYSEEI